MPIVGSPNRMQSKLERNETGVMHGLHLCLAMFGSFILQSLFVATIVQAELQPTPDYRTAFPELPTIELPCIPQTRSLTNRNEAYLDSVSVRFDRDKEGKAWLVITNDFPWRESVEIHWNGLTPEVISALDKSPAMAVDHHPVTHSNKVDQRSTRWRCDIQSHTHAGWEIRASEATITHWQHRADPDAMAMLENQIGRLSQSLAQLTQFRPIENTPLHGGFETSHSNNLLPSEWVVSLNPTATWTISDLKARSGTQSIRFDSQHVGAVGWIQSPSFDLPEGGRVAAEAWLHFDPALPRPKIVATTTLLKPDGSRQDWKQTYQKNEIWDKNAMWQRIDFPTLNSSSLGASITPNCRVRLALDIEGPTQIWIDDFAASKIFLDEEERRQLRSQLYVARRELSQNRPSMAWQLTQSKLSHFVSEQTPATALVDVREAQPAVESLTRPKANPIFREAERQPIRRKLR